MSNHPLQPKNFIRILSLIHYCLCAGLLFFMAFAYWQRGGFTVDTEEGDFFVYLVPVVAMVGYFASKFIFQNLIRNLPKEENLQTKLERYQIASLIQYALIEAPAILALVAYLLNSTALYLVIASALMIYLFVQRPSYNRLVRDVPMSFEEKKQFDTLNS